MITPDDKTLDDLVRRLRDVTQTGGLPDDDYEAAADAIATLRSERDEYRVGFRALKLSARMQLGTARQRIAALEAERDALRLHIMKRLRAPSGELICCCRNAAERSSNYCWYCAARDMLDEK